MLQKKASDITTVLFTKHANMFIYFHLSLFLCLVALVVSLCILLVLAAVIVAAVIKRKEIIEFWNEKRSAKK